MPRHDPLPPGTPCWVELSSEDPGEAARFYGALFDWRLVAEEYQGYGRFLRDGKVAAGLWPEEASGAAARWTVYFTVEDVEVGADLVQKSGGQVVVEPHALGEQGTLAGCLDPEGVFFMLWKPAKWGCTELLGRPGCWGWTELFTRDLALAEDFYPRVFGWGRSREGDRVRWTVEGQVVAGMLPLSHENCAEALPTWLVHFSVTDVQETAERAEALGAVRIEQFHDPVHGTAAVFTDPQNAQFALVPVAPQETKDHLPLIFR